MRKSITLPLATAGTLAASMFVAVAPASAHGYVSSPPSRQAQCAQRTVSCGGITYEPQSVEAPKGSTQCSGGGGFSELNDNGKGWRATSVGSSVAFTWTNTAMHRTTNWEYFINGQKVGDFPGNNAQPPASVTHQVNLGGFSGRQTVLARWNIADTVNAFYSCVDVQIGGGSSAQQPAPQQPQQPAPQQPQQPAPQQPQQPAPQQPQQPAPAGGSWAAGSSYATGSTVTYGGATYRCVQGHTALAGWEPPIVPALWARA